MSEISNEHRYNALGTIYLQLHNKNQGNIINLYDHKESIFKDNLFINIFKVPNYLYPKDSFTISRNLVFFTDEASFNYLNDIYCKKDFSLYENLEIITFKEYLDGRDYHSFVASIEAGPEKFSTSQYKSPEETQKKNEEAQKVNKFWLDSFTEIKLGFFNISNISHHNEFIFIYIPEKFINNLNSLLNILSICLPKDFDNIIVDYSQIEHPTTFKFNSFIGKSPNEQCNYTLISGPRMYQAQYFIK